MEALIQMQPPSMGDHLQQLLCAANWMRSAIPDFSKLTQPLAEALEKVYQKAGKRTKRAIKKIPLTEPIWTDTHVRSFKCLRDGIRDSVTLAHADEDKILCLFTDASENRWAGIVTQIPPEDESLPFDKQRHEPLLFMSGAFRGSSSRWSTPEKEAYAIIASIKRADYLLIRPGGFRLFTDHKNLTFIFHSQTILPALPRHVISKIERWAMTLAAY